MPLVLIEHWPKESTNGGEETFELVVFSQLRGPPYLGETRTWIGGAAGKPLDVPPLRCWWERPHRNLRVPEGKCRDPSKPTLPPTVGAHQPAFGEDVAIHGIR